MADKIKQYRDNTAKIIRYIQVWKKFTDFLIKKSIAIMWQKLAVLRLQLDNSIQQ